MVAKDFTLQQVVLPLSRTWVECHERMARWFILMDHKMQAAGGFYCILCILLWVLFPSVLTYCGFYCVLRLFIVGLIQSIHIFFSNGYTVYC